MRNFYVKGQIDGRKTEISGGPRCKNGGFTLNVYMREEGGKIEPVEIQGRALENGMLELTVFTSEGRVFKKTCSR